MDWPVDLDQSLGDTPSFRASLSRSEQDMHRLETLLEKVIKLSSGLLQNGKAFSSSNSVLINGFNSLKDYFGDSQFVAVTLGRFTETLSELQSLYRILFDQFQRVLADGVKEFLRKDVRCVKDTKKVFDKASSEMDSALQKNSHASRSKLQEREEASRTLADMSVAFRHTALDYGYQVNLFHVKKGHRLLHTMLSFMEAQSTFFRHGYDVLKESQPLMKTVAEELDELAHQCTEKEKKLTEQRCQLTAQVKDYNKLSVDSDMSGAMMRGYLWKRGTNAFKTWNRRYFFIQNNQLLYQNKFKGDEVTVLAEDLRLCTLKPADDQLERRFCFEIVLPTKSVMVQADSEEIRTAWITAVQKAAAAALDISPSNTAEKQSVTPSASSSSPPDSLFASSEKRTAELKRIAGNETCADCDSPDSTWASINLGVTLCIDCSGIHRSLGVHVSKVRSLTLDQWEPETGKLMMMLGNSVVNGVFEQNLEGWKKPTTQSSRDERETYIRAKYIDKRFLLKQKIVSTSKPVRVPLTIVTGSESDDSGDEDPFPVATDKREVTMDSIVLSEATSDSDRISPEIHRKTYSQPVSPVGRRRWTISKPKRAQSQDELDVLKGEGEAGSISDTETVSKPKKSRRKRVLHKLKKLSPKKKLLSMTGTEKEESRLRRLSVELHTHAGSSGNSSQILYEATKTGDISGMLLALACGADVNWKNEKEDIQTSLHQAVRFEQILALEFLLQNGGKVNLGDKTKRTPLHLASQQGGTGLVCLLLKRGAKQDVVDEDGQDPLAIALSQTHADIVTLLRLAKLNKDMKENDETAGFDSYKAIFNDFSRMAFNSPDRLRRSPSTSDL